MYSIGFDIGSSSIKGAIVELESGDARCLASYPPNEMPIIAQHEGWAEQDPEFWWSSVCTVSNSLIQRSGINPSDIKSVGIAYQMHGLVLVDKHKEVLRPSIIWCDSRAVDIGNQALHNLGERYCLGQLLNSPGNFTASKLRWVQENEPRIFDQVYKMMLPGDYIAMKLTGEIRTTPSGLSEGILWNFRHNKLATELLEYFGINNELIPEIVDTFSDQGHITQSASTATGLPLGIPVSYRAGDQPNNALSLGVLNPGEIAGTGGTSGVIYGISDEIKYDQLSRVNGFAHVNHGQEHTRIGQLLCINGSGSQYAWLRKNLATEGITYPEMEQKLKNINAGSDGLHLFPFGNGAERMLGNRILGAQIHGVHFNIHKREHFYRAALEGIAFSFVYGIHILKELGINPNTIKVGNDNLFQSEVFSTTISTLLNCQIDMIDTTGAIGAAKASSLMIQKTKTIEEIISGQSPIKKYLPNINNDALQNAYDRWVSKLEQLISSK